MRGHHRSYNYKFTEKSHSARGIWGLLLALLSLTAGLAMIVVSFLNQGNGTVYLGSGGVLSMLAALTAFILAVQSMREENSYKAFPLAAVIFSVLALGGWIAVYVLGFLG